MRSVNFGYLLICVLLSSHQAKAPPAAAATAAAELRDHHESAPVINARGIRRAALSSLHSRSRCSRLWLSFGSSPLWKRQDASYFELSYIPVFENLRFFRALWYECTYSRALLIETNLHFSFNLFAREPIISSSINSSSLHLAFIRVLVAATTAALLFNGLCVVAFGRSSPLASSGVRSCCVSGGALAI